MPNGVTMVCLGSHCYIDFLNAFTGNSGNYGLNAEFEKYVSESGNRIFQNHSSPEISAYSSFSVQSRITTLCDLPKFNMPIEGLLFFK